MAMKPKRTFASLAFQTWKTAVRFTGLARLGLVLVAFGLPVSGEWLAAVRSRGSGKNRRGIQD